MKGGGKVRKLRLLRPRGRFLDERRTPDQAIEKIPARRDVTVCIATLSQGPGYPMIVGASDRMLTHGIIEFEPRISKIYHLSTHIVALIAGDTAAQASIVAGVLPPRFTTVLGAAEAFSAELSRYNRRQAERKVLAPLGLTIRSFFDKQPHLTPDFVEGILHQIKQERAEIETIICGTDATGAHIYVIDEFGRLTYGNSAGFAAIGGGAWHAQSQLMYARFDPLWESERAMLLTYIAKRRAEVTPGVGTDTDLFFISAPHGFVFFQPNIVEPLAKAYDDISNANRIAIENAHLQINQAFDEIVRSGAKANQEQPRELPDSQGKERPQPKKKDRKQS